MIHYHGSPLTPESAAAKVYAGRHAMVSFAHPEQLPLIAEVCQSFALDNGAFSAWRSGSPVQDWSPFRDWIDQWRAHPGFDWFLIPDVIDGTERENDDLTVSFEAKDSVPIWHLHESIERLSRLMTWGFQRIAIGSSGKFATIGTEAWWTRMDEAMRLLCDDRGRPYARLHGLRMLDPQIFTRFPFASADSTNAARNVGIDGAWKGTYPPAGKAARGIVIADRIEAHQSASVWKSLPQQTVFSLLHQEIA